MYNFQINVLTNMDMSSNSMQKLSLLPLISLVTGNLVGSSVFLLPATLAAFGAISLVAWLLTTCGAIILALMFAELSHKIPKNGGPYAFVNIAFGPNIGFYTAWGYWVLSWISNSALVAGAAGYLTIIFGPLDKSVILLFELTTLLAVTLFNLLGLKATGKGEMIITIAKVIPLILIPLIGMFFVDFNNFPPFNATHDSNFIALNGVAFITLWGFVGLETATVPGAQVVNARRNIPIATILGTLIAASVYIAGTIVIFGVIPYDRLMLSSAPYADAASSIFGGTVWPSIIAGLAVFTCIGSLNGWTIIVGRIAQAAAEDGLFPKILAKTNSYGTPVYGILLSSLLTLPFVIMTLSDNLMDQFNFIINVSVTFILLVYLLCFFAFIKLCVLSKSGKDNTIFMKIYHIIISILSSLFLAWALYACKIDMLLYSLLIIIAGVPVRLFLKRIK